MSGMCPKSSTRSNQPRQQGPETASKPVGSSRMMRSHFPTSSLQPTIQDATCHSRRRAQVSDIFNHLQHIPQAWEGQKNIPPKPSDTGDHGHSKPVYLLPSSVRKPKASDSATARHHRCSAPSQIADHEPPVSGAVKYASSLDVDSSRVCWKGVGFVALTSQYRRGTHVDSSRRKRIAVRRYRIQSEDITIGDIAACALITMPQTVFSNFWLARSREVEKGADFQAHESRRSKGDVPASRVKQRVKLKNILRSQFRIPMKCRPAETEIQQSEDREVVCVVFLKDFAMRASPEMRSLVSMIQKEIQNNARSQIQTNKSKENAVHFWFQRKFGDGQHRVSSSHRMSRYCTS
jgi:hypothetical protein